MINQNPICMKAILRISVLMLLLPMFIGTTEAQDLHFTNNHILPTFFNPAQAGAYAGTYRAGLIYRDQWRSHAALPYQSAGLFVDSPVAYGLTKQHWIGVGATLFYDKAGSAKQTWNGFYPGVSYHIGLDKKLRNVVTIGAQYGFSNRGYADEGIITEYGVLNPALNDPDLEKIKGANGTEDFSDGYSDLNVGVLFKSNIDKYSKFEIGAGYMHVLKPEFRFAGMGSTAQIDSRINGHLKYRRATSRRMIWEPSAHVSFMPDANNILLQVRNEYLLKKKGDIALISGLGFRVGDSIQLLLGADYKGYVIAFSYDHVISGLAGAGIVNAFELGVIKTFLVNKKPKVDPIIYCPRL